MKKILPSSVDVIGDIRRWNDPVSNSFSYQVCFRDAFGGACFPVRDTRPDVRDCCILRHANSRRRHFRCWYNGGDQQDSEEFPAYDKKWNDRAEDLQLEIFQWEFDHVPSFARRLDKSEGVNVISHTYDNYWAPDTTDTAGTCTGNY